MKGTSTYDKLAKCYANGAAVPSLITRYGSQEILPPTGVWGDSLDSTIVYVERVIAYYSRSLKSAERNYSATEREALGAKEGLVKFQPFIEGEQVTLITDHAALQWARAYEHTNRRLAAWGAVYAAYPGLRIIHRPGRIHSNVDPISRLPRIPQHNSPIIDDIPSIVPDAATSKAAEERERAATFAPAERAAFTSTSWWEALADLGGEEIWDQQAFPTTAEAAKYNLCSRTRTKSKETTEGTDSAGQARNSLNEDLSKQNEAINPKESSLPTEETDLEDESLEGAFLEELKGTPERPNEWSHPEEVTKVLSEVEDIEDDWKNRSHILLSMPTKMRDDFVKGYRTSRSFKRAYVDEIPDPKHPLAPKIFHKGANGLLYFSDADWVPRLCVPENMRSTIMALVHDQPTEGAHEGPKRFAARLRELFYWPSMAEDAMLWAST